MKYDKPPKIYVEVFDKWRKNLQKRVQNFSKNAYVENEKELQREISYKLEMALEEADRLIEMLESNVIAICEFILTKIEDEDGMHVFTLFNKTNQKYMDPLEIEPVSKFIKYGENGLLS